MHTEWPIDLIRAVGFRRAIGDLDGEVGLVAREFSAQQSARHAHLINVRMDHSGAHVADPAPAVILVVTLDHHAPYLSVRLLEAFTRCEVARSDARRHPDPMDVVKLDAVAPPDVRPVDTVRAICGITVHEFRPVRDDAELRVHETRSHGR